MPELDLNLLTALDALLADGSVEGAAQRLGLSASAMSRTLARLRAATGDPLLVRAGRGLVPTPRAAELRERVRDLAQEAQAVLRPSGTELDISALKRAFTIRANEGFVETFAGRIVAAATAAALGVHLRFAPKPDKNVRPLREGLVDLEIGVLGATGPEPTARIRAAVANAFLTVPG
jgi:DNA-binding transcriptional LysR family regulator